MEFIYTDVQFHSTMENEELFCLQLRGIWKKIKADNYIKKTRVKEIRSLLKRNAELDLMLEKEKEERQKLMKKMNILKKILE